MRTALEIMRRSVMALFLREIRTRFGKYQLGYAWALLEPIGAISVLLVVFTAFGAHVGTGISFPVFLINGVVLNSLFVDISNRSIKAMEANSALFNYRPIRPIDTVIARAVLELMLHLGIYAALLSLYVVFFDGEVVVHNLPLLLASFLMLTMFSGGVGVFFMLLTDAYADADKVLPLITRPLFFVSGVFFSIDVVPVEYQPLLLWNPIFHGITLARESVASNYNVPEVSLAYLAISSLVVVTLALFFYRLKEQRLRLR